MLLFVRIGIIQRARLMRIHGFVLVHLVRCNNNTEATVAGVSQSTTTNRKCLQFAKTTKC